MWTNYVEVQKSCKPDQEAVSEKKSNVCAHFEVVRVEAILILPQTYRVLQALDNTFSGP